MNPLHLIILSLIGMLISCYLYYTKLRNKKVFCLLGHECDAVVNSPYGKTFGIENTMLGVMYYALIFAYGAAMALNRNIFKDIPIYYFIVGISAASVLFSLYLIWVQAFVLKKWCDYCTASAIVSLLIFLVLVL